MNHAEVGGIINSLPIETMVAAPVLAAVNAQKSISKSLAEFVNEVGLDSNGNVRMVTFQYAEQYVDDKGATSNEKRYIQAPFLALTGIPNFAMEAVDVSFDLEVNTVEEDKSTTGTEASSNGKVGFFLGPKVEFSAKLTHQSEQTRHTDTRAKYSFNVSARRQGPPESFMRIIDAITSTTTQPTKDEPAIKDNLLKKTKEK